MRLRCGGLRRLRRRSYDGYVPLHKLTSNFLYVGGWLVPLGPRGGGFQHMCTPRFSAHPQGVGTLRCDDSGLMRSWRQRPVQPHAATSVAAAGCRPPHAHD